MPSDPRIEIILKRGYAEFVRSYKGVHGTQDFKKHWSNLCLSVTEQGNQEGSLEGIAFKGENDTPVDSKYGGNQSYQTDCRTHGDRMDDYRITSPLGRRRKRRKHQFWVASERVDRPIFCQEEAEERERE